MKIYPRNAILVAMIVASATTFAACGSGTVGSGQSGGSAGNKNLWLIPGTQNEPFYISMQCGAQDEAKALGYQLHTQAPESFDPQKQTPIVTAAINDKPAGLLIAPTDVSAMAGPERQAKNAGIKVVEVDTALQDDSIAESHISSDNIAGGKKAADTLGELLAGRSGSVLALDTIAGTSTTNQRAQGFADEIKAKFKNLKVLQPQFTNNEPTVAAQKVNAALSSTPDLVGIFATNLNSGQGAATALSNARKAGQVQLVGFDASPNEVNDLRAGKFQALIAQDPATIGKEGVDQAVAATTGKPVQAKISTDLIAITSKDMDSQQRYFYRSQCS